MIRRACFGLAVVVCAGMTVGLFAIGRAARADEKGPNLLAFEDAAGPVRTFNVNGAIDEDNPFFQDLGTNGPGPSLRQTCNDGSSPRVAPIQSSPTTMDRTAKACCRRPLRKSEWPTACC